MKTFIQHRVNSIEQLKNLNPAWGVEVDLRSDATQVGAIHLTHDPWVQGEKFEAWLKVYKELGFQGPIILNTKEDGLEAKAVEMLKDLGVNNYFFLDTQMPTLIRWALQKNHPNFAVRLSCFELREQAAVFIDRVDWLWVDCFYGKPVSVDWLQSLKKNYKVCLVSPELQGFSISDIVHFQELLAVSDAICTKSPEAWLALIEKR